MISADDVPTNGNSTDWSRIGEVFAASVFLALLEWYIQIVDLLGGAVQGGAIGLLEWITALVSGLFGVTTGTLWASWRSASEFVVSLGPFAFLAAVGITFATLFLLLRSAEVAT